MKRISLLTSSVLFFKKKFNCCFCIFFACKEKNRIHQSKKSTFQSSKVKKKKMNTKKNPSFFTARLTSMNLSNTLKAFNFRGLMFLSAALYAGVFVINEYAVKVKKNDKAFRIPNQFRN